MSEYVTRKYAPEEINKAGKALVAARDASKSDEVGAISLTFRLTPAMDVIDNFRAAHAYPAQVFYVTLKRHAEKIDAKSDVAQRIKRMPSIIDKLERERDMKLTQMQDIGGCRAVVRDVKQIGQLQDSLKKCRWAHEPTTPKDYLAFPKASGYRGIHLKYRFIGAGEKAAYSGLKVELQLRSRLQHQWATAVEAADTFTRQSLKQSRGSPEWERFFALMASVFALREGLPLVPNTPTSYLQLAQEVRALSEKHHIANMFSGYASMLTRIEGQQANAQYFLVTLDPVNRRARIRTFRTDEAILAQRAYSQAEAETKDTPSQVVLVSTSSVKALKRVYPNYFLDTADFMAQVNEVISDARAKQGRLAI